MFPISKVIIVWVFILWSSVNGKGGCKDLVYLPCVKNKAFKGHVFKSFQIPTALGEEECQSMCYIERKCVSYNLVPVSRQITTCELNDLDHVTHPDDVKPQEGSEYCPVKNPCSSNPCTGGKLCIPDFYEDSFSCSNGIWSQWSAWCKCPTTGTRVRKCRNPSTQNIAADCPEPRQESSDYEMNYEKVPTSCSDALHCGCNISGVYTFKDGLQLFCDQETNGGGWTVFQRRQDGSQDFYLGWQDYKVGFGNLTGEFWLGLDKIHQMTNQSRHSLRVDLEDTVYAEYDYFAVSDEAGLYRLSLGNYSGTAGDSLYRIHRYLSFSTKDRDNDLSKGNCAVKYKGAWWYQDCLNSNLNGLYHNGVYPSDYQDGIVWKTWKGWWYSAKKVEMKIRPKE